MIENQMVVGDYYEEGFDDWPAPDEMDLILEAVGLGEWQDHYPTVQIAYDQAYRMNAEEMEAAFQKLRREEQLADELHDELEDIGRLYLAGGPQAW